MRERTPGASAARRQDHDNPVESRRLSNPRAPRLIETPEELRAEAVDLAVAHRVDALAAGVDAVEAYRADFFERTPLAAALEAVLGRDVRDPPAWVHGATAPSPRLSLIGYRLGDAAGGPSYVDGRDGKRAVDRRVSSTATRPNEVRLQLGVLAYNLGNLWRRLVLPPRVKRWSLTSLQQRLVKTGGRLVKHARYYWLLLAEGHLTRRLFGGMLRRIWALPVPAD